MDDRCCSNERIWQFHTSASAPMLPEECAGQIRHSPINRVREQAEEELLDLAVFTLSGARPDLGPRNHTHPERPFECLQALECFLATAEKPNQHVRV